jgi:hypothetical protein
MFGLQALVFIVGAMYLAFGLSTASYTLGCDFYAYYQGAHRFLTGVPIYDLSVTRTGDCGVYQYPPPFVLLALPFSLAGSWAVGSWLWILFLLWCFLIGTFLLPVRRELRWAIVLCGLISWPLNFGVRIGQVGPILYLVFALGWRYLDRPGALGTVLGIGSLVKLQPALLVVWLFVQREWRAIAAMFATIAAIVVGAAAIGLTDWVDFVTVTRNLSSALTVPGNLAVGAVVYSAGFGYQSAAVVQFLNTIAMVGLVALGAWALEREAGYLLGIVASQLISPIIWDHYSIVLLLPVAWLLSRRQWWVVIVPLVQAWVLLPFEPNVIYLALFYLLIPGLVVVGWRRRSDVRESIAARGAA